MDRLHLLHKNPPPRPAEPLQHTEDQRAAERDRVRVQFDRIDADDSGTIGAGDLAQELERLHLPFTTEDLHDILEHADAYNGEWDRRPPLRRPPQTASSCHRASQSAAAQPYSRTALCTGEMGFNEFYEYYTTRELQLREVFEATDLGGDGRLHCKEVQASMVQLGFSVSRKEVGQMMKRLESDEDGCVTWEAWRELLVLLPHTHCEELFSSWQDSTAVWQPSIPSGQDKWGKNGVWIQHFCSGGKKTSSMPWCRFDYFPRSALLCLETATDGGSHTVVSDSVSHSPQPCPMCSIGRSCIPYCHCTVGPAENSLAGQRPPPQRQQSR